MRGGGGRVALPLCTIKLMAAIADPFAAGAVGVCMPGGNSVASRKVRSFTTFVMTIGTSGVGYVTMSPTLASDAPCFFYTTSAYTIATVQPFGPSGTLQTGVVGATISSIPYTSSDLLANVLAKEPNPVCGRIVCAGMNVRYQGTVLNQGGTNFCVRSQDHTNVVWNATANSFITPGSLGALAYSDVGPSDRRNCVVSDFPCESAEMEYLETAEDAASNSVAFIARTYPFARGNNNWGPATSFTAPTYANPVGNTGIGVPSIVFAVQGTPGNAYYVEGIIHAEYIGNLAQSAVTPTESDPVGTAAVIKAAASAPAIKRGEPGVSFLSAMSRGLQHAAKVAQPLLLPLAEKAILSML